MPLDKVRPIGVLTQLGAQAPHPPLHPGPHGQLVTNQAAASVHQLLYTSQAYAPWAESQLIGLLEQARTYNQREAITGLLLHQGDRFVQLLEGDPKAVQALYARIAQDPRHHQVVLAHAQTGTARFFADWAMAYAMPDANEFYWLLDYLEARQHRLVLPQVPIMEPHLLTLLNALQHCC